MTLRTITYDTATHKLVPLEPTFDMELLFNKAIAEWKGIRSGLAAAIEAAPEYQEPEQLCDDGGKCGAGGYCITCPKLKG